ncbi:hypothetical protein [Methylobrevis pamukkalensis]|uniref:Uncharacterized protein n=1 Tax=Methylobrevis pamukkalensis TaxID=1439726 RepID=A0A1E3GYT0_9HYPH|nr:hypothetical protein [Methylobrevis pamukkalensis]ODN69085.1 hypothetical protein A6302_03623 [Methylobrevis pamukkalensis]
MLRSLAAGLILALPMTAVPVPAAERAPGAADERAPGVALPGPLEDAPLVTGSIAPTRAGWKTALADVDAAFRRTLPALAVSDPGE